MTPFAEAIRLYWPILSFLAIAAGGWAVTRFQVNKGLPDEIASAKRAAAEARARADEAHARIDQAREAEALIAERVTRVEERQDAMGTLLVEKLEPLTRAIEGLRSDAVEQRRELSRVAEGLSELKGEVKSWRTTPRDRRDDA